MRIAIAGLGTIGKALARKLADGVPGLELACVAARDEETARGWLDEEGIEVPIVALEEFPAHADLAVECAPAAILEKICRPMLTAGKQVMVLSCGALLPRPELLELAKAHGGRIIVPTGGLLGLDAVAAANEGTINSVRMTTRKPPNGLAGAPHLVKNGISVEGLNEPKLVFSGTARDAAAGFPANVNVVAALAMAGIGPDRTMIDIWADPTKTRNCHVIEVDADFGLVHAVDRERAVGKSEDRPDRRALDPRDLAQARRAAARRNLSSGGGNFWFPVPLSPERRSRHVGSHGIHFARRVRHRQRGADADRARAQHLQWRADFRWRCAARGPKPAAGCSNSIGYVVIAVAVFDVAKYFVEEEVIRGREMRLASEARRSLTKFVSTIAIAVFIEALVMVFRQGSQDIALILYPAAILVTGILIILGLGLYQRLSADVEGRVDAKDRAQDKQDKVDEKNGKAKKA